MEKRTQGTGHPSEQEATAGCPSSGGLGDLSGKMLVGGLRLLPQNTISRAVGAIASVPVPRPLRRPLLGTMAYLTGIDLKEAEHPVQEYRSFGALFSRHLQAGQRPIASQAGSVVSPCDGTLGQIGRIENGQLLQAKGRQYSLGRLLGDEELASLFLGGTYVTIYLSPRNYHRVHCPVDGKIIGYRHLPGYLLPVNPAGVRHVDELFAVNERLITLVDGDAQGQLAVVMVGATSVGRMTLAFDSVTSNRRGVKHPTVHSYPAPIASERGQELGAFNLGSTVVLVFERDNLKLHQSQPGMAVRMGQILGHFPDLAASSEQEEQE